METRFLEKVVLYDDFIRLASITADRILFAYLTFERPNKFTEIS